jgi:hypothetical protein
VYSGGGGTELTCWTGVDLEVARGEAVAIIGASGAGKSTLLHLLGGLDRPTAGEVEVGGRRLDRLDGTELAAFRNRTIGFVFQFHHLLREFTAEENVMMPQLIGGWSGAARERARELLAEVGLLGAGDAPVDGAERRRAAAGGGGPGAGEPPGRDPGGRAEREPGHGTRASGCTTCSSGSARSMAWRWSWPRTTESWRTGRIACCAFGRARWKPVPGVSMLCDQCGENEAVIHLTQIVDNQMGTFHLCEACAADKGLEPEPKMDNLPLTDFLAQMSQEHDAGPTGRPECEFCGLTLKDFKKTGRLGARTAT